MGLFDTIHLHPNSPIACPACALEITEFQTKEFGKTLLEFRIGSLLRSCGILTGIIAQPFFCERCGHLDKSLYLVIWHSILVAVEIDLNRAEAKLAAVDRLNLIEFLDQAQQREDDWKDRFFKLYNELYNWHERLNRSEDTPQQLRLLMDRFRGVPEELLNSSDPLGEIINLHKPPQTHPFSK
ncbi:MAG: hypothetical protein WCO60_19160 [Verrucomicrobiota bacterium]